MLTKAQRKDLYRRTREILNGAIWQIGLALLAGLGIITK